MKRLVELTYIFLIKVPSSTALLSSEGLILGFIREELAFGLILFHHWIESESVWSDLRNVFPILVCLEKRVLISLSIVLGNRESVDLLLTGLKIELF